MSMTVYCCKLLSSKGRSHLKRLAGGSVLLGCLFCARALHIYNRLPVPCLTHFNPHCLFGPHEIFACSQPWPTDSHRRNRCAGNAGRLANRRAFGFRHFSSARGHFHLCTSAASLLSSCHDVRHVGYRNACTAAEPKLFAYVYRHCSGGVREHSSADDVVTGPVIKLGWA